MSIAAVVARKRLPLFARLSFLLLAVAGLILPAAAQVTFSSLQRTLNQTIAAPEGVAVDAAASGAWSCRQGGLRFVSEHSARTTGANAYGKCVWS